jgi:hypothetical protein
VATEQLHFGGQNILRSDFPIPKLGHILSDDISIPEHIIESDSSFHRAKLAQGDQGIDSGQ